MLGRMKTEAQQRRYVEKTLKLQITLDDEKRPGVIFSAGGNDVKTVRMGRRMSHSKIQEKEAESKEELDAMAAKSASALKVSMEEKDPREVTPKR